MQQVKTRRRWYQGQPPVKALLILPSNVFVLQETKKGDDLVTLGLCFDAKDVFELGLDRAKNHHKRKSIFQYGTPQRRTSFGRKELLFGSNTASEGFQRQRPFEDYALTDTVADYLLGTKGADKDMLI
ncbi:hypothetical protein E3N88_09724 [Mikania micrantha]|uniref:Uncharacterized protein n=1 Tax=Mikania micrantha TaxID=192012 RepID=A0A5N6PKQ6_9ASTR|nr:hypothetical protein E3N88_09724 [Mikania micrantha]